jgi:LacI family transcriptional regulator
LGQSLRFSRTNTLALIVSDITNPFWTTVVRGVEDAASEADINVVLCNTDENPAKQNRYISLLLQRQVDGFLLVPSQTTPDALLLIQQQGVPVVVLDRRVSGTEVDVVRCDSEGGAFELVQHLIGFGHRRIACIAGPQHISTSVQRVIGYQRALVKAGLKVDPALVGYGEFTQESGYCLTQELLNITPPPTAWFAANNFIAIGVLRALRRAGLRVPDDMSVVAFDDLPLGLLIEPFLTVAAQPAYDMGYQAAELLLRRIGDRAADLPPQEIVLPVQIMVRASCRALMQS